MKEKIELLKSRLRRLFWKIAEEKEHITIDGVPGYNDKAQFTNGKVINLCSWVAAEVLPGTAEQAKGFLALREVIRLAAGMKMETWGILNAMEGLYRLKQKGLLDAAVDHDTMAILKAALDWRTFVDENHQFALIDKPTNYYGVAFGIARYRELLGWEPVKYSEILLNRLMAHINQYSGSYGFMDETPGLGRFDRYSILIPAEIMALVMATGWQEPALIRSMLNRSAHIVLQFANGAGTGFAYGRSIGAYGETAALQILSTAAAAGGIFTQDEECIAYGYCCCLLRRMIDFWYDEDMQSINMWEKGRKTDGYRNKNRILGENLSLPMQMIDAMEQWSKRGYTWEQEPVQWLQKLSGLDTCSMTLFADEPLPRYLAVIRDHDVIWQLPMISGGNDYFDRDPYLPVPRANLLLEAVPDASHGAWLPCLEMQDGTVLMPAAYIDDAVLEPMEHGCRVIIHQHGFVRTKTRPMELVAGADIFTAYTFRHRSLLREDEIHLDEALLAQVSCVRLACDVTAGYVRIKGYETETQQTYQQAMKDGICLDTPHGPCRERIVCEKRIIPKDGVIRLSWQLSW